MKLGELRALTLVTYSAPPASGGQERHPSSTQTLLGTKAALDAETETHTEHDRALGVLPLHTEGYRAVSWAQRRTWELPRE